MIADYNGVRTETYTTLTRKERFELINEALDSLVLATAALRKVVKAELEDSRDSLEANEDNLVAIHQLGNRVLQITQATSEADTAIENLAPQDFAEIEDEIEEPELGVVDVIIQPEAKPIKTTSAPRNKQKATDKRERYPIPTNNRFYTRILPAEEMPQVEIDEEAEPIEIEIISDDTISFNGKEITLKGDELYVFNAFMLRRNQAAITASEIRQHGFRMKPSNTATVTLSIAISKLRERLQAETDSGMIELISKQGKANGTTYSVNPAVVRTGYVREGSTVTVEYTGAGDDNQETFRIPNRYKQPDPSSPVKTLANGLPLIDVLLGAKPNEPLNLKSPNGATVNLKVVAIH